MTIKYSDESEEEITDADFTKLLDFLNEILNGFIENVDETKETIHEYLEFCPKKELIQDQ